jgi:hypothetical protein
MKENKCKYEIGLGWFICSGNNCFYFDKNYYGNCSHRNGSVCTCISAQQSLLDVSFTELEKLKDDKK